METMPKNFVAEINGHRIYANDHGLCDIYTSGVGWWAFNLPDAEARRICASVGAPGRPKPERPLESGPEFARDVAPFADQPESPKRDRRLDAWRRG